MIGAKPELSRRLMAVMGTNLWFKLSKKDQLRIGVDVESGKDFKNLKKNTKDFFKKAEQEIKTFKKKSFLYR
tara:strand:- start:2345 stop:2560 length:216 start_codon:yes stop_codon:yes gene_type:complete